MAIVSKQTIIENTNNQFAPYYVPEVSLRQVSDTSLECPTYSEIVGYLKNSFLYITPNSAIGEGFDCDDFAFVFKGITCQFTRDHLRFPFSVAIGIIWGKFSWIGNQPHACNWVYTCDNGIWLIEPQTRAIYPINACILNSVELIVI